MGVRYVSKKLRQTDFWHQFCSIERADWHRSKQADLHNVNCLKKWDGKVDGLNPGGGQGSMAAGQMQFPMAASHLIINLKM